MLTKRKFQAVGAFVLIVLAIVYVARPPGHIPPYDANLTRLAESELEGYCSGKAFWMSGGTPDSKNFAAECRTQNAKRYDSKPNMMKVQPSFCQAIVDEGWEGSREECLSIMADNEYWPTYDGGITNAWNRARPYPRPIGGGSAGSQSGGRTGGHQSNTRDTSPTRGYGTEYPTP